MRAAATDTRRSSRCLILVLPSIMHLQWPKRWITEQKGHVRVLVSALSVGLQGSYAGFAAMVEAGAQALFNPMTPSPMPPCFDARFNMSRHGASWCAATRCIIGYGWIDA